MVFDEPGRRTAKFVAPSWFLESIQIKRTFWQAAFPDVRLT